MISAETADFSQAIQSAVSQLTELQQKINDINKGGSSKGATEMFKGLEKASLEVKKEIASVEAQANKLKKILGDKAWELSFSGKIAKNGNLAGSQEIRDMVANLNTMKDLYKQITDTLLLKETYTAAEASETNQQTADLIQQESILNSIGTKKWNELVAEEGITRSQNTQVVNLSDMADKLKQVENATKRVNEETEKVAKTTKKASDMWGGWIGRAVKYRLLRMVISQITKDIGECVQQLALFDKNYNSNMLGYNKTLSDLTSNFKKLTASLTSALMEMLNVVAPILTPIINALRTVFEYLSMIFAMLGGKSTYTVANPNYWKDYAAGIEESSESAKELKKTLASFDELDILNSNNGSGSSSGLIGGINPDDMYITKELPDWMKKVAEWINNLKEKLGDGAVSLGEVLGITALIVGLKKLWDWIKKVITQNKLKNGVMGTETDLAYQEAYAYNYGLVPALGLVAGGIALAVSKLKEWAKEQEEQNQKDWGFANNKGLVMATIVATVVAKYLELKEKIKQIGQDIRDWFDEHSTQLQGALQVLLAGLLTAVAVVFLPTIGTKIAGALASILASFGIFSQTVLADDSLLHDNFNTQTENGLENSKLKWTTKLATILAIIGSFRIKVGDAIGSLMENLGENFGKGLETIGSSISNFFTEASKRFSEWGSNLGTYFSNLWNTIGTTITNGVNGAIDKLNGLVSAYKKAKAEDYANQVSAWQNKVNTAKALGLTTAIAFVYTAFRKISLPSIGSLVPKFANGGVIDSPTVGLMGEYPGARTNPEIITPENKMRDIIGESNKDLAILLDRNNRLLEQLLNKDTSISIGDDVISASAARGNANYMRRTGKSQFAI